MIGRNRVIQSLEIGYFVFWPFGVVVSPPDDFDTSVKCGSCLYTPRNLDKLKGGKPYTAPTLSFWVISSTSGAETFLADVQKRPLHVSQKFQWITSRFGI